MSGMVGKVARALAIADVSLDDAAPGSYWEGLARAAIAAMREPTEAMILNRWGEETGFGGISVFDARKVWSHMIDAALKEAETAPNEVRTK